MAGQKRLPPVRVVAEGEELPPQTFSEAAARGTRLDELRAMRRVIGAHIDSENTLARDLAALMRQAREISKEIEELEGAEASAGGSVNDDSTADDAPFRLEAI